VPIRSEGEGKTRYTEQRAKTWRSWFARYPIVSIEDGHGGEDGLAGWRILNDLIGDKCQLVATTRVTKRDAASSRESRTPRQLRIL